MTKIDSISLQAKRYKVKQVLFNVAQCAIIGFLFTLPAWVYLLD